MMKSEYKRSMSFERCQMLYQIASKK